MHALPPSSWQGGGLEAPNHLVARQDKQLRSRLCCPCAGVWRQPERISHRQCCHSSGKRIWHGSGLWYRWPTPKTPGSRQVVPISNAALQASLAAFKSPDGEQDRRGDEGSCGSRSGGEWCRWDLVHHQGLGPGLWGAGQRRTALGASHSSDPPALRWAFRFRTSVLFTLGSI